MGQGLKTHQVLEGRAGEKGQGWLQTPLMQLLK